MDNNLLKKAADILGVSEDSITAMDNNIREGMAEVLAGADISNDKTGEEIYEKLDSLWQKGSVYIGLAEVAKTTGIPYNTLRSLDTDTQQNIVYEYMMDSSQVERFYNLTNDALAVIELDKVADLVSVPVSRLKNLPQETKERICGMYAMEYDEDDTNAGLIDSIREMIADE